MAYRKLILERDEQTATADYTHGKIYYQSDDDSPVYICESLERGWRDNVPNESCVPLGTYQLEPWQRPNGDQVYILTGNGCCISPRNLDPGNGVTRWGILIHPANRWNELEGCIAPVSEYAGDGVGWSSKAALGRIRAALNPHFSCFAGSKIEIRLSNVIENRD